MSTDIMKFDTATDLVGFEDLDAGLGQVVTDTHVPGFEKLLRMSRDGEIVFGADNTPLGDSRVAINPLSVQHGWVAWSNYDAKDKKKNEILGEAMVPAKSPKPMKDQLDPRVDPGLWKDQVAFHVLVVEGTGRGEQLLYKVNSVSGVREALALINRVRAQYREAKAAGHRNIIPICRIGVADFPSNFGKQFKPVWNIVDWTDPSGDLGALYADQKAKAAGGGSVKQAAAAIEANGAPGVQMPADGVQPVKRSRRKAG